MALSSSASRAWAASSLRTDCQAALERFPRGVVKAVQPAAVSVSQVTEAGTLVFAGGARRHFGGREGRGHPDASRRRAVRQCDGGARLLGGRDELEARRRRGVVRRDEEWLHRLRGGGFLRQAACPGLPVSPQARRAHAYRRAACSARSLPAISPTAIGWPMPAMPMRWRSASRAGLPGVPGVEAGMADAGE